MTHNVTYSLVVPLVLISQYGMIELQISNLCFHRW